MPGMADALNDLGDALDALADASFIEAGTDLSVTRGMRSAVYRSTSWPKRSATVPRCLRVARRTGRSGRCSSECCGKATARVGAARTGETKRLRATAWIVASTRGVRMERSGTLVAHVLGLRRQGGPARPLAENSRPSPVLQIAPQARVPPSSGPKHPCGRRTGRSGRSWSGCFERPTARVQADDDVFQVHVARGGGQRSLQRATQLHLGPGGREGESERGRRAASSRGPDRLVRRRLGPGSADRHRAVHAGHPADARLGASVLRRRAQLSRPSPLLIDCEEDRTLRARSSGYCWMPTEVLRPQSPRIPEPRNRARAQARSAMNLVISQRADSTGGM
jgi:hypothetical protein